MSYLSVGATGAASFKLVGGVAKPVDAEAFENFKKFQQELSRHGSIKIDGEIGPLTAKLYNSVMKTSATPAQIATAIPAATLLLKGINATVSIVGAKPLPPAQVAALPAPKSMPTAPPVLQPDGTYGMEKTIVDKAADFITSPMGMVAGAAVVGLLVFMKTRKKGGGSAVSLPAVV